MHHSVEGTADKSIQVYTLIDQNKIWYCTSTFLQFEGESLLKSYNIKSRWAGSYRLWNNRCWLKGTIGMAPAPWVYPGKYHIACLGQYSPGGSSLSWVWCQVPSSRKLITSSLFRAPCSMLRCRTIKLTCFLPTVSISSYWPSEESGEPLLSLKVSPWQVSVALNF